MTTPLEAAHRYVDICTGTLKEHDFFFICSEKVTVSNRTNGENVISFSGREAVVKAFADKIFNNTKGIKVKSVGCGVGKNGVSVYLDVKAYKLLEDGSWIKHHFIERTDLTFEKVNGEFRLLTINMKVTKELI